MLRLLQGFSVVVAVYAGILAVRAHRHWPSGPGVRWGTRGSLLLSLSIVVGTAPAILVPSVEWARWTGLALSCLLTLGSLSLIRRQYRVLHS
jgi:hypothetical protein